MIIKKQVEFSVGSQTDRLGVLPVPVDGEDGGGGSARSIGV